MAYLKSCTALVIGGLLLTRGSAWGQSIIPNGAGTLTTVVGNEHQITGGTASDNGANLFHSFEQFGLTAAEAANFVTQPNVVNVIGRVNGGTPSIINGQLRLTGSDANLFLLNPVGILFGAESSLALPGDFNASTADGLTFADGTLDVMGTPDYGTLVGNPTGLAFRWSQPGSIINGGDLRLRNNSTLTLSGGTVVSTGTITAGEVAIATVANEQLIRLSPDGSLLSYDIAASAPSGDLSPLTLPELLTGTSNAIATGLQIDTDGTLRLVNTDLALPTTPGTTLVNGTITASEITLLGHTVGVVDSGLDASGVDGGGSIYIGGSYQGQGPLPNAQITYISPDSVVDASAINNGDGGEIIVFSDQTTRALGQFLARGGRLGGKGGLIETSGLQGFILGDHTPDVSATVGAVGLWLIDPFNVEIDNFASMEIDATVFPDAGVFTPVSSPARIDIIQIINGLRNGDVTITTGTLGTEEGNITLLSDLLYDTTNGPATLTLDAAGSIFLNGSIRSNPEFSGEIGIPHQPLDVQLFADNTEAGLGQIVINSDDGGIIGFGTNGIDTSGGDLTAIANSSNLTGLGDLSAIILADNNTINTTATEVEGSAIPGGSVSLTGTASDRPGILIEETALIVSGNGISLVGTSDTDVGVLVEALSSSLVADFGALSVIGETNGETAVLFAGDQAIAGGIDIVSKNGDIQVESLVSQEDITLTVVDPGVGDIQANGSLASVVGNITVSTEQFVRVLGTIPEAIAGAPVTSVSSAEGTVTITHGGNGLTPFIVGDAAVNGTAAGIVATADEIQATESFLESEIRGDISILTGSQPIEPPPTVPQPPAPDIPDLGCVSDCPTIDTPPNDIDSTDVNKKDKIRLIENSLNDEYQRYLGLDSRPTINPDFSQVQGALSSVSDATGIAPALVYVTLVPTGSSTNETIRLKADQTIKATDTLELVVITPQGSPILKTVPVSRAQLQKTAARFRNNVASPGRLRARTYLSSAQQLHEWLIAPIEEELAQQGIGNLAFIMPPGLRSIPVAALHDGEQFLIERYSVGLMPSVSLTDLRYVDVRGTEVLAMGASNFVDQPELPAVPLELNTIANDLWPGDILLNETFTADTLVANRTQKPYGILHLATHGEFKAGGRENSYIQFWDQRLGLDQVRALGLNHPPVELMVLSACRTALGNREAELGFAGLAVQAGVKTALASLWKVDDVGTAGLMTQFYTSLQAEPMKAEALRQTQLAMLQGDIKVEAGQLVWPGGSRPLPPEINTGDGTSFSHPYFWAAFTVIGSPW